MGMRKGPAPSDRDSGPRYVGPDDEQVCMLLAA